MKLLEVCDIKRIYRERKGTPDCVALNGVSFSVDEGEFVAIMGPSGSGKTTLLNILASLDAPSEGRVLLDGRSFSDIPEREQAGFRRQSLGFVFQDFNLLDTFSLRDNILLPLVLSGMSYPEMEQRLVPVADMLHISELLNKYPYEVSGGQKQRAAVARAVITNPRLILADEPTGALDSASSAQLLDQFARLNREGRTILMVTHSAFAASYSSRVLFIRDGKLAQELMREQESNRAFFDRIVGALSMMGGADVG